MIDAGLPADTGIDHREQSGRHLNERHAPQQRGRDEAGHVADHPPAERHHRGNALQPRVQKLIIHRQK